MQKISFNENWHVQEISADLATSLAGGAAAEKIVTLPHDAMVSHRRFAEAKSGGSTGFFPGGDYTYTRIFHTEEADEGRAFLLNLEGVYSRGYVYVNDSLAGSIMYGYTDTYLDISGYLNWGTDNTVMVKVVNSDNPNTRWYTGSGLYRPVSLYIGDDVRVEPDTVVIKTLDVSRHSARVNVCVPIRSDSKARKTVTARITIKDGSDQTAAIYETPVTLTPTAVTPMTANLYVEDPALWSPETPSLYVCSVEIESGNEVLDQESITFGIRSIAISKKEGFLLNGEPVLLRGGCIHHDNGPVGACAFAEAEERKIRIMKEAGFNAVRIAHNNISRAMLDACDRLGMLVMDESFDAWTQAKSSYDYALYFKDNWKTDLTSIIRKDRNHPSVIMYSIGNEIMEIHTPEGAAINRELAEFVRNMDNTRFVTNAFNSIVAIFGDITTVLADLGIMDQEQISRMVAGGINDIMTAALDYTNEMNGHHFAEERLKESFNAVDIIGLNYARGAYDAMEADPSRIFFGSETDPPDIDLNWAKVKALPSCIGDFCWTAWDYIGEAGVGVTVYDQPTVFAKPYPVYLAYCGDIDITGYRRPMSYYREIVWGLRTKPYIAVQLPGHYGETAACTPWATPEAVSSWTWKGFEGKGCLVEVYSDAPEVELVINGTSVGKLPAGEKNRFKAVFDTVYAAGRIEAISHYEDGHTEKEVLHTAEEACEIRLTAEKSGVHSDGITYVDIDLIDRNGLTDTDEKRPVRVSVTGSGELVGFTSADPCTEENFFDSVRTPYYGRLVAVIRRTASDGTICLTASAEDLEPQTITLK